MKFSTFFTTCLLFGSCQVVEQVPKCGDEEVKKKVIELFNEEIKEELETEYYNSNFNYSDIREYLENREWDYSTDSAYIEGEKTRIRNEATTEVENWLKNTSLNNIRADFIDKEIKKCECTAEIKNPNLKKIELEYSAQKTQDKENSIFIEIKIN